MKKKKNNKKFKKLSREEYKSLSKADRKEYKKERRRNSFFRRFFRAFFILLIIAILGVGGWFFIRTQQLGGGLKGMLSVVVGNDEESLANLQRLTVLVMGESGVGDGWKLTDSIMVISYNPQTQQASILSIPRDTYVGSQNPNSASQLYLQSYKINTAYRAGSNIPEAVKLMGDTVGLDLQNYLIIDTSALIKVVDAIGSVTFNVPIDMDYDDPSQDLYIHLKAGVQEIDGPKAEQLLRFRHNNDGTSYPEEYGDNDFGRMRTQREFISTTMHQLLDIKNIPKIKDLIDIIFSNVQTNMDGNTLKKYIPFLVEFNTEDIKTGYLPGDSVLVNGVYIYKHSESGTKELVDELFKDEVKDEKEINGIIEKSKSMSGAKAKVEITNSSGSNEKLTKLVKKLYEANFAIVKVDKTDTTSGRTSIVNRAGKSSEITGEIETITEVGKTTKGTSNEGGADISIIIGRDYDEK